MVNVQSGNAGATDAEKIDLANRHQNIMATIDSLSAIETSMLNNLQNDMNNSSNIESEVQKISKERANLYNQLKQIYEKKITDVTEGKYALADKLAVNKILQTELDNINGQINQLKDEKNNKKKLIQITDYEFDRYYEYKKVLKTVVYGFLIILICTFLMKQPWFPKMLGIGIICITIAYVFILTIGRIMDNGRRSDINYAKFEQTHDNGKWNKERDEKVGGQKGKSLVDHLFASKCQEVFSNKGPLPYQPPLNNIKNVRS